MINVTGPAGTIDTAILLGASKSISNRILVLNAVLDANTVLKNLSDAEDTRLLQTALNQIKNHHSALIDVKHAGTDFRFLTAVLAISEGDWLITGSEHLRRRPVGKLVDALCSIGADIEYVEKHNFPPLKIKGKQLSGGEITIDGGTSSQFISALLLISPTFRDGMKLRITGEIVSAPYISMTIACLKNYGVNVVFSGNVITVMPGRNSKNKYSEMNIESDWSSASYWYSICALSPNSKIRLKTLHQQSLQADAVLPVIYGQLGVKTSFEDGEVLLENVKTANVFFVQDFTSCPDIAQTVAVTCFGLGIKAELTGLNTLKIKETDRLFALQNELKKCGAEIEITDSTIHLSSHHSLQTFHSKKTKQHLLVETYNDHRMAMSFAPLALLGYSLLFSDPDVVSKSYPVFWSDLKSAGFNVNLQS